MPIGCGRGGSAAGAAGAAAAGSESAARTRATGDEIPRRMRQGTNIFPFGLMEVGVALASGDQASLGERNQGGNRIWAKDTKRPSLKASSLPKNSIV